MNEKLLELARKIVKVTEKAIIHIILNPKMSLSRIASPKVFNKLLTIILAEPQ